MKDSEVKKQVVAMSTSAAIEANMLVASLIRHLIEYPNQTGKWFVYLTNWKMMLLGADSAIKFYKIKQALNVAFLDQSLLSEKKSTIKIEDKENDEGVLIEHPVEFSSPSAGTDETEEDDLAETRLRILREPGSEILTLNIAITVDLLYWGLDRSGGWPSYILHSLDALALPIIYVATDTPLLSSPKLKDRFVIDHMLPFAILAIYAIFYGLYQGAAHGVDENGDPPYPVLDWHEEPGTTAIYSTVLPVAMPVINGLLLRLAEKVQAKLHPGHGVKDYRRQNICIKITKTVKNGLSNISSAISLCIWPRSNAQSSPGINADAQRPWYRRFC